MTHQSFMLFLVISRNVIILHKMQNNLENFLIDRYAQCTVCIRNDAVGSSCIKSSDDVSFFICSNWKLCFISIMKWLFHANNRLHNFVKKFCRNFSDPFQITTDFSFFKCKLGSILHLLNLAATTSSCHRTRWLFYTIFRRRNNIHKSCITVVLLCLHNLGFNHITDNRIFYK